MKNMNYFKHILVLYLLIDFANELFYIFFYTLIHCDFLRTTDYKNKYTFILKNLISKIIAKKEHRF